MTKVSRWALNQKEIRAIENEFWEIASKMKTAKMAELFFRDLLTHTERQMLAKRLQIAKMLLNKESYNVIKKTLHVTDTTIAKVNNWLKTFGQGYRLAVDKLKNHS